MTRPLPTYLRFQRRGPGHWRVICKACGLIEEYPSFWPAADAAHDHADWHAAEEDPPVTSAGVPSLAP